MDKQTEKTLRRITHEIPKELSENVTKTVVDTSQEDAVRQALNDPKLSAEKKRDLGERLFRGDFRHTEVVENEKVIKEIDRYHTERIAQERRKGTLSDPRKDRFIRERLAKMRRR